MRAPTCSSAPPCSKGFLVFWASSACAASATSYPSCSAAPLSWPSAFSWAAPVFKAGRSLLAFGSNFAVKRTASPPLTLAVSPAENSLYLRNGLSNGIEFLRRFSALGLSFLRASPAGAAPVFSFFGRWPLRSKREQLSFFMCCVASVAQCFFSVRARRQVGVTRFGVWV